MATLKNRKWYDTRMMHRAGKPQHVFHMPLSAIKIENGLADYVGTTQGFITWRDGRGVSKEFARLCAGIEPHRLYLVAAGKEAAAQVIAQINNSVSWAMLNYAENVFLRGFTGDSLDIEFTPVRPAEHIEIHGVIAP